MKIKTRNDTIYAINLTTILFFTKVKKVPANDCSPESFHLIRIRPGEEESTYSLQQLREKYGFSHQAVSGAIRAQAPEERNYCSIELVLWVSGLRR